MKLSELLIADIERDAEASRKVLERVPLGHDKYKPHEKSMELGPLVYMVTTMVEWTDFIVNRDELDPMLRINDFPEPPPDGRVMLLLSYP